MNTHSDMNAHSDMFLEDVDLTRFIHEHPNTLTGSNTDNAMFDLTTPVTDASFTIPVLNLDTSPLLQSNPPQTPLPDIGRRARVYDVDDDIVRFLKIYDEKMQELYKYTLRLHRDIAEANNNLHRRALVLVSEVKRLDEREKFIEYRERTLSMREAALRGPNTGMNEIMDTGKS